MTRSTSNIACQILLALIPLGLTGVFFVNVQDVPSRNVLLIFLLAEALALAWFCWRLLLPLPESERAPIHIPKTRPQEALPPISSNPPRPKDPYVHRPQATQRPPARTSDPIPTAPTPTARHPKLPPLPTLSIPQPGRTNTRTPEPTPRPATPKPIRQPIRLDDLLPPAPPKSAPAPTAAPAPKPRPTPSNRSRPLRPAKYANFSEPSSYLPATIALGELNLCSDILSLGYACATSDGPVTSEEDTHLLSWMWCVIENTTITDAPAFLQKLTEVANQSKMQGKQKLDAVTGLGAAIRATGEKQLIQAAGALCGEIIELDSRLEPGEFATLSMALKALGLRNTKAAKIAEELLSNDSDISDLKEELGLDKSTSRDDRERILSVAWNRENARMQAVTDSFRLEEMRQRMKLIQKIRDLYRELDQHG
jgi:hypothetical protein